MTKIKTNMTPKHHVSLPIAKQLAEAGIVIIILNNMLAKEYGNHINNFSALKLAQIAEEHFTKLNK